MNIYDFFNSPDVAEYCQSMGKTFNALESAVMILQSMSRTLAEKHAAFRTIIAEYPDMEIPGKVTREHIKSFHKALRSILAYEERKLERLFMPETGVIYQASIEFDDGCSVEPGLYTSYERAASDALECFKNNECVSKLSIRKKYPDSKNWIGARISLSGEIMEIGHVGMLPMRDDDDVGLLGYGPGIWASCYIDVPVPFKRGDLVEGKGIFEDSYMGKVYVLKDICRDDPKRHAEMLSNGDLPDMTANVFYESGGSVRCDCIHFYPDLRYCRRELEGEKRILKYLSHFMKDEICACSLLKLQKYLLIDEMLRDLKDDHDLNYELDQLEDKLLRGNLTK